MRTATTTVGGVFLPDRVRQLRREKGLSRTELAHRAGACLDALAKWESGRTTPKPEKLAALAAALGVEPSDLFGQPDGLDEAITRLVAAAPALTLEQRDRLAGLLRPAVHLS